MLQCVTVCLQCVLLEGYGYACGVGCSVLQCATVCCSVLQCVLLEGYGSVCDVGCSVMQNIPTQA